MCFIATRTTEFGIPGTVAERSNLARAIVAAAARRPFCDQLSLEPPKGARRQD
jgi:hypothetical protein